MRSTERRASRRDDVDYAVRVDAGERSLSGRLTSLSRLGALVVLEVSLPVGTPLALLLEPPSVPSALTLRGQVVRVEPSGTAHALGVMFAPLAPLTLIEIDFLLAR